MNPTPPLARASSTATPAPIADYAVLGDGSTAALVSLRGSVDWMCVPHFDSDACFAALLGDASNGRWLLTVPEATQVTRRYVESSFVLETTYVSSTGTAVVTETMPVDDERCDLVRQVVCTAGQVDVLHEWVVRFGYGSVEPWVSRLVDEDGEPAIRAIAGPDALVLRGDVLPEATDHRHEGRFTLRAGERVELALTWFPSWRPVPRRRHIDAFVEDRIDGTRDAWGRWAGVAGGPRTQRAAAVRSLLVLRLLTDAETGGIVAAPTTSLPELVGGERNWDYRFCWLRDAAMTLEALVESGYRDEAHHWRDWLLRAVAGDPNDLQIMYRLDGGRHLPERTLEHLAGYRGSQPVRVGNAAVGQVQHDVLGEVMCALALARDAGLAENADSWSLQRHLVDDLVAHWTDPDRGIWEVRGEPQRFTHSKVMAWAAVDRAVRAAEQGDLPAPLDRWRAARDAIHADVLATGWDERRGTFVQHEGATHTDAALLQIAIVGFLPPDDPRLASTVAAIRAELEVAPGLLLRYRSDVTDDGVAGHEHAFLACSGWLAHALAVLGDVDEAERVLATLVSVTNDVGLLAEQYDPRTGEMTGNMPQALSHLALVRAAHAIDVARGLVVPEPA